MRYAWIEGHRDRYAVAQMCRQLNVSRSGYLQWRRRRRADLTYITTDEGWLYLPCVHDLGSRKIVGWAMSERMKNTPQEFQGS